MRCGKVDTETPRSRVKLDSAFPRNSGGRPALLPVKEKPSRLATSSSIPSRSTGKKPYSVDNLLTSTGGRFLKAFTGSVDPLSPSRTRTHVRIPSKSAGRKPYRVDILVPSTGGPFSKAPTGCAGPLSPSRTPTHVRSAHSFTVEQGKPDNAHRTSGDSTTSGQINRSIISPKAGEAQIS